MKNIITSFLLVPLILTTVGCASLKQTDRATGAFDAATIISGAKPDVAVIETISDGGGDIAGARAVADHGGVLVYGTVQKQWGYEVVSTASYYIDVTVLDSSSKVIAKVRTDFFPHEIPRTTSRSTGFSYYSVRSAGKNPTKRFKDHSSFSCPSSHGN